MMPLQKKKSIILKLQVFLETQIWFNVDFVKSAQGQHFKQRLKFNQIYLNLVRSQQVAVESQTVSQKTVFLKEKHFLLLSLFRYLNRF